jgi:aminodeoxyfutalosine deaminase
MKILRAEHVLPISSEPIVDGAVAIDGDRIVDVGSADKLVLEYPAAEIEDFGRASILPGFVNCHSHLEVTSMRGALDSVEHDFASWLLKLNDLRSALSEEEIAMWAISGAREGAQAGVTCFGDIGRYGLAGVHALKEVGLRGVVFQETEFSPDNSTADEAFSDLKEKFLSLREQGTSLVEVGLSPHAPYTVSRKLFERIAEYCLDENIKVTIHAAESVEEDALLTNGEGFFMDLYQKFGVNWEVPRCSPVEFLLSTGILEAKPLLAHCVTVNGSDIETIAATGTRIAHCSKSNAKFGHGYAPFEKFLDAGVVTGLGTDSVASNNTCDPFEEARFAAFSARNHPARTRFVSARDVLTAATLGGAAALGLEDKIGTLEAGKQADVAVVSIDLPQLPVSDIEAALVFSSNARDVAMTMVAGCEVFRR